MALSQVESKARLVTFNGGLSQPVLQYEIEGLSGRVC